METNKDHYYALKSLLNMEGYKLLQGLWAHQGLDVMEKMQRAAAKGNESAWRYYAGQVKGYELAITQLERSLKAMEVEMDTDEPTPAETTVRELLKDLKGEER